MFRKLFWAALRVFPMIAFGVVIAFVMTELGVRFLFADVLPIYTSTGDVGRLIRPNISMEMHNDESDLDVLIETNEWGLRDDDWDDSADGPRILVIGDSFVEAAQVQQEDRFTELIQRGLRDRDVDATVGNCGVSGAGPSVYLQLLTYCVDKFKPDINILAFHSGNDFFDSSALWHAGSIDDYTIVNGQVVKYSSVAPAFQRMRWNIRGFLKKSTALLAIHNAYSTIRASAVDSRSNEEPAESCPSITDPSNVKMAESLPITEYLISEISSSSSQPLLVFDIPSNNIVKEGLICNWNFPESWLSAMSDLYEFKFVPVLDSLRNERENLYWAHLNHRGHELLAEALTDEIEQMLAR